MTLIASIRIYSYNLNYINRIGNPQNDTDLNILLPFHDLNLDFLRANVLLLLGRLQFIGELGFGLEGVHFDVEAGLLQLVFAVGVGDTGVCGILGVKAHLFTLGFLAKWGAGVRGL